MVQALLPLPPLALALKVELLQGEPEESLRPAKNVLPPQVAAVAVKAVPEQLVVVDELHAFSVTPLLTQAELGKAATSYGSSYIEVELSRMNPTFGSCPDW